MTAPLTPPDCNLQDFPFMPLYVQQLRDSKLTTAVKPDRAFFAVILWCASWHQVPAASLPDDDAELAKLAGFGFVVKEWKKYRQGALYGWIKCDDGRLYHPVVAEKARDAWAAKNAQRYKTECARIKKHNQRHGTGIQFPALEEFLSPEYADPFPKDMKQLSRGTKNECPQGQDGGVPRETASKGQGEGYIKDSVGNARASGDDYLPNPTPHGTVAKALRAAGVQVFPSQLDFRAWVDKGLTADEALAGLAVARQSKPPPEAIPWAYLAKVLTAQRQAAQQIPEKGAPPQRPPSANERRAAWNAKLQNVIANAGAQPWHEIDMGVIDATGTRD